LKRTTRLATGTLMIAANLPDVDVLVFATDMPSVAFRRGWTHGVLAQIALPVALAGIMYAIGRLLRSDDPRPVCSFRWLLLISYLGVLSHVGLDLLNNYGVRVLMPFSNRWFYLDSVFIIDPWLWLAFGVGIWLAVTRDRERHAQVALIVAAVYIGAMVVSARIARDIVRDDWRTRHGREPHALMVGPMPLTPFTRMVIVDGGAEYATGVFKWFSRGVTYDGRTVPKNDQHPAVRAAIAKEPRFRAVLIWARFPFYEIERTPRGDIVTLRDVRFGNRVGGIRTMVALSSTGMRPRQSEN
jgi:inner membrane protein